MSKPRLFYFDAPISRGEECRLAFVAAGVDFEDARLSREAWLALKPTTPYGAVPVLEMPGKPALAQSNAILTFIGRTYDAHPKDAFEAARHEAVMGHVEDLRTTFSPTMRIKDDAEKKVAREDLLANYFPTWSASLEKQIGDKGPFFDGAKFNVVDCKIHMAVRWFAGGNVDHVPPTVFAAFPKITRVYEAVRDDARVKAWYAKGA